VNQADMVESAIQVSAHGEDLALNHQTTDGQIASAQGGWAGSSALAMAGKVCSVGADFDGSADQGERS
jgi:hypothetical protein